jgi:hypothetical protein
MATVKGVLAQNYPSAGTEADLYTVPDNKTAVVKVIIANQSSGDATFRVSVAKNGVSTANGQYIAYDKAIAGNDTGTTTVFMINAGDVLRVYASATALSFTCTGIERDQ